MKSWAYPARAMKPKYQTKTNPSTGITNDRRLRAELLKLG